MSDRQQLLKTIMGCGLLASALCYEPKAEATTSCNYLSTNLSSKLDHDMNLDLLMECAKSGDPLAQLNLGRLLITPALESDTDSKAIIWYIRAARQGLAQAQFELALLYLEGKAVTENRSLALDWLDQAARQGHHQAQFVFNYVLSDDFSIGC